MFNCTSASYAELDVSELIAGIKSAIIEAQKTSKTPYMNLPWVEGEISYVVGKEGQGGFKLYVVTAEGKYATEAVQRVKFRLEPISGKWRVEKEGELKMHLLLALILRWEKYSLHKKSKKRASYYYTRRETCGGTCEYKQC